MLFTARSRKSIRPNHSGSKDSKQSNLGKKPEKIQHVSAADLKLRQAINMKYEKSKVKNYKCTKITSGLDYEKSDNSLNSIDMPEYAPLLTQRFINLKQYHKKAENTPQTKQYLIKFRHSNYKKTIKTEQNNQSSSKLHNEPQNKIFYQDFNANTFNKNNSSFQASFKQRKTLSGDKKELEWKKLGFNYHSTSKNNRNGSHKRAPSQQEEPKSRLYYFRKKNKSPQSKYV